VDKKELFKDNIRDTHWIGEVVDVIDPLNQGRCRIRVYGKFDTLDVQYIPFAIPANSSISGAYSVPNIGDVVSVYFDNGDIYTPIYRNQVIVDLDLKSEVLDGSSNPEAVTSLVYDSTKGIRMYHSPDNGLVITTGNGPEAAPALRISNDGKIYLNSDDIFISSSFNDESEPAVKGQTLTDYLKKIVETISNHTHVSGSGPTNPITKMDMKFLKAKLDNIKQKS
tara:strand:+ start:5753 stop:6424 length:672 start_codon:yes stop_codon:yes gene_type:complete